MSTSNRARMAAVLLGVLAVGSRGFAETKTWVATTPGNASEASNWSPTGVPVSSDDIVVDALSTNMTWDAGVNGLPDTVASWTQNAGYAGTVTFPTVYSGAFETFTVTGSVVLDGGKWTHAGNTSAQTYRLKASVGGNLTVALGASIDAAGKGYSNNSGKNNGCHGGNANNTLGSTYGDPKHPTDIGACYSTSAGGGAIHLAVDGAVEINGSVTASGVTANVSHGGAGGSILIEAASVTGSGSVAANGAMGTKSDWHGNAGSGGRVALLTDAELAFPTNQVTAYGRATGYIGAGTGAGTVFLKRAGDVNGTLIVANSSAGQTLGANGFKVFGKNAVTPVNAGESWTFDAVLTKGYGVLAVPEGTTLSLPNGLASVKSLDTTVPVMDGIRYDGGTLDIGSFATQTISDG